MHAGQYHTKSVCFFRSFAPGIPAGRSRHQHTRSRCPHHLSLFIHRLKSQPDATKVTPTSHSMMCRPTSDNNISTNTNTNCHSSSRRRTCTCGRRRRPSTVSPSTVSPSITAAEIMSDLANEDDINSCQELRNQAEVQLGTSTKKLKTNIDYYYGPLNDEIDKEGRQPNLSSSTKSRIKNLGTTYAGLPRPDSKGRVGSKECHFFSFCDDLDDEIEFELAQEEANDKDSIY